MASDLSCVCLCVLCTRGCARGVNVQLEAMAAEAGLSVDALYQTLSRLRRQLRDCVQRRLGLTLESE